MKTNSEIQAIAAKLIAIVEERDRKASADEINELFDVIAAHHTQAGAVIFLIGRSMMRGQDVATKRAIEILMGETP